MGAESIELPLKVLSSETLSSCFGPDGNRGYIEMVCHKRTGMGLTMREGGSQRCVLEMFLTLMPRKPMEEVREEGSGG